MTPATQARERAVAAARDLLRRRGLDPAGSLFESSSEPPSEAPPRVESFAELATLYPQWLAGPSRKASGAWFTPRELAEPLAERTLAPLQRAGSGLRIVDPACGGGAFLVAALRARTAAGARARDVATRELHGIDSDPTAAALAAWLVHEACGDDAPPIEAIETNVRAGDGLVDLEPGTFDVVVGNPPWETVQKGQGLDGRVLPTGASPLGLAERGKTYTYRLFAARALELLRPGGRLGLVLPASLYFDRDARALREHLLHRCRWEWLYAFENRERVFAIDGRYRFCAIVAETAASTEVLRAAFARTDLREWAMPEPPHLAVRPADLIAASPSSGSFVEVCHERDLELLRRMHRRGRPLLGDGADFVWRQGDFNMTTDRDHFVPAHEAKARGYRQHEDGVFRDARGRELHPLLQGAMIDLLHPNHGAYAGGEGRAVRWTAPARTDRIEPQYLVATADLPRDLVPRVAVRALSNATNARTTIACLVEGRPTGNSLGVLRALDRERPLLRLACATGVLASLSFDWAMRQRLAGTNLNAFVLADTVLPETSDAIASSIARRVLQLCAVQPWHGELWRNAHREGWVGPEATPIVAPAARADLRVELEVLVARAFGFGLDDLAWMLRDCDWPCERLRDRRATQQLEAKGFWRVDRELEPEQRLPVRVLRDFGQSAQASRPAQTID